MSKSELATIRYPAWRLERNARQRVIVGSYTAKLMVMGYEVAPSTSGAQA